MVTSEKHFIYLHKAHIRCTLGLGLKSTFQGVGVSIFSFPSHPKNLFVVKPVFLSTKDDAPTLSTGALRSSGIFASVIHHTGEDLKLTPATSSIPTITTPVKTRNILDYVQVIIRHPRISAVSSTHSINHLAILPPNINVRRLSTMPSVFVSLLLHLKYGHRAVPQLQSMINAGLINGPGIPKKLAPLPGKCPICEIMGAVKLSRGPCVDTTELPVGSRIHFDFTFFNVMSLRGFVASFQAVDATSRNAWSFPTRHKRPPIDIAYFLVCHLRRQGYPVISIRVDEGGELARSTEFMKLCYDTLQVRVETTGGYASTINGMVEAPHRTLKRSSRCLLVSAGLPDTMWCFAFSFATLLHNNVIHTVTKKIPCVHFSGTTNSMIQPSRLFVFGSKMRIIKDLKSKRALAARTGGDPRDVTQPYVSPVDPDNLPSTPSHDGIFVGYSNHSRVMLCYNSAKNRLFRVHHALVDEMGIALKDTSLAPSEYLLRNFPLLGNVESDRPSVKIVSSKLDEASSPFDESKTRSFKVKLPPRGAALGITCGTNEHYFAPYLKSTEPSSPFYKILTTKYRKNAWIVSINDEEPITGNYAVQVLKELQVEDKSRVVTIILCRRSRSLNTNYEDYRSIFGNLLTIRHAHMAAYPERPPIPSTYHAGLGTKYRPDWKLAAYSQYDKNNALGLYTQPFPRSMLPPGTRVLPSVLAPNIKEKGDHLWAFVARHCANGSSQIKGIDYLYSYSPTASAFTIRLTLSFASSQGLIIGILDVVNCFQNTLVAINERLVVTTPPYWMDWFKLRYPECKLKQDPNDKYVIQICNGIQGDRAIGRRWYLMLVKILDIFGCKRCPTESALFIYRKDGDILIVNCSTDDLLCAYSNAVLFHNLRDHIKKYVEVTTNEGSVLKYLNLRIVQSKYGISFDQTEHIRSTILDEWFPNESKENVKPVHTPFRTDNTYERELAETLPASSAELIRLAKEYRGSYPALVGQLMHVAVWSRLDIGFAISRLARYTPVPSEPAFAGLKRIGRYLFAHQHRPIYYARLPLEGIQCLRYDYDSGKSNEIEFTNRMTIFADADHARDARTRRSLTSVVALFCGVSVDFKFEQQSCVAIHSTEGEIIATFTATKKAINYQAVLRFLGIPGSERPITIFQDSQPTIDTIASSSITGRAKHIAVPVLFIHERVDHGVVELTKTSTDLQPADPGTKPLSAPIHFRHNDFIIGVRYYPKPGTDHYQLAAIDQFTSTSNLYVPPSKRPQKNQRIATQTNVKAEHNSPSTQQTAVLPQRQPQGVTLPSRVPLATPRAFEGMAHASSSERAGTLPSLSNRKGARCASRVTS